MAASSYYAEFIDPAVERLIQRLQSYPELNPNDTRAMYAEEVAVAVFQSRAWPSIDQTLGEGSGVVALLEGVQHQLDVYLYNETSPSEGLIIHAIRREPELHSPYGNERVNVSQAAEKLGVQANHLETLAPLLGAARMDARRVYAEFPRLNVTYGAANAHGADKALARERGGANLSAYDPRKTTAGPSAIWAPRWDSSRCRTVDCGIRSHRVDRRSALPTHLTNWVTARLQCMQLVREGHRHQACTDSKGETVRASIVKTSIATICLALVPGVTLPATADGETEDNPEIVFASFGSDTDADILRASTP